MSGNFKVRCVDAMGQIYYTEGKVYDITDSTLTDDNGNNVFTGTIKSFKNLEGYSIAKWELVDDYKEENSMRSFKVRCVDRRTTTSYIKDKIYNVIDGELVDDCGAVLLYDVKSFENLQNRSRAEWELVDENTKKLSLTITSEKATISDGEDTFEVDSDWYKNERDMMNDLFNKYYSEKNKIKVGDTVKVIDKGYQYKTYSDFIFDNAEELQKQMSATEFSKLILNFKIGESIPERESTYKINLINTFLNLPTSDIKVAIISNDKDTFIINIRGLEKAKER